MTAARLFFVGRNYAKHIKELGNKVPDNPLLFFKPLSALGREGHTIHRPHYGEQFQQEAEVAVKIGSAGRPIGQEACTKAIEAVTLGLDMTLRDVQQEAKEKGLPWDEAKGFDDGAKLAEWKKVDDTVDLLSIHFFCHINDELKQEGDTAEMMLPIWKLVEAVGAKWSLLPGDVIFTGTPAGVCDIQVGDEIRLSSEELGIDETFSVKPPSP